MPYQIHWLSFVKIEPYFKSMRVAPTGKQPNTDEDLYTCPTPHAMDGTIVTGSTAIVECLDGGFPDTSMLLVPGARALQEDFNAFFDAHVGEAMAPVCAPVFPAPFDAASVEYFRRAQRAGHGERLPLKQWAPLGVQRRGARPRQPREGLWPLTTAARATLQSPEIITESWRACELRARVVMHPGPRPYSRRRLGRRRIDRRAPPSRR